MATTTEAASQALHLKWAEKDRIIVVEPEDQDRYVLKVSRAVELLGLVSRADKFQRQLIVLQRELAKWLQSANGVDSAFLTLREGALSFVVIRANVQYDDHFEDSLSDLDFTIANDVDLDLVKIDTIALPPASRESLNSFLDSEFLLEYISHAS